MKIESFLFSLLVMVMISCGGGGGSSSSDNGSSSGGGSGGGGGAPTVPRSIFFEGCADSACTERKLTQVNLDSSNNISLIASGEYDSTLAGVESLIYVGNKLYFSASPSSGGNQQLWIFDPLADIETGVNPKIISTDAVGDIDFSPRNFVEAGSLIYFSATTSAQGRELWQFDTSAEASATNPSLVYDIYTGSSSSNPNSMIYHQNKLFFVAEDGVTGIELRVYDPAVATSGSNPSSSDINPGTSSGLANELSLIGDKIYFSAFDGPDNGTTTHGVETWVMDTTLSLSGSNPSLEIDFTTSPAGSFPGNFVSHGGFVYFTATTSTEGYEIRRYNPAEAVSGTNPSTIEVIAGSSSPNISNIYVSGDFLYFDVDDTAGNGDELWRYDTTQAIGAGNPAEVFDLEVAGDSAPEILGGFSTSIVFEATTSTHGREIWIYDSSQAISIGTNPRVIDAISGADSSQIDNYVLSF